MKYQNGQHAYRGYHRGIDEIFCLHRLTSSECTARAWGKGLSGSAADFMAWCLGSGFSGSAADFVASGVDF